MRTAALLMAVGTLAACSAQAGDEPEPWTTVPGFNRAVGGVANPGGAAGGTLRLVTRYNCLDWLPEQATTDVCRNLHRLLTRQLTAFGTAPGSRGSNTVPDLAQAPGEPDESRTRWSYRLREGVEWSDGTPVTAQQVAAGIARAGATIPGVDVRDIEVGADGGLVVVLAAPVGNLDAALALPQAAPLAPAASLASGPFMVQSVRGPLTVLARNPHWTAETDPVRRPLADQVQVRQVATVAEALDAVDGGQADLVIEGTLVQRVVDAVVADPAVAALSDNVGTSRTLMLAVPGYGNQAWQSQDCRQAVFSALDRHAVVDAIGGGIVPTSFVAFPATTLSPPTISSFDWSYEPFAVGGRFGDVPAARALLETCAEGEARRAVLAIRYGEQPARVAAAIRASVARAGIEVEVVTVPAGTWRSTITSPAALRETGVDWVLLDQAAAIPGVWGFWYRLVSGDLVGAEPSTNVAQASLPAVDVLLDSEQIASDDSLMLDSVGRTIDRLTLDSGRYIPLAYVKTLHERPAYLTDVTTNGALGNQYDLVNIGTQLPHQ